MLSLLALAFFFFNPFTLVNFRHDFNPSQVVSEDLPNYRCVQDNSTWNIGGGSSLRTVQFALGDRYEPGFDRDAQSWMVGKPCYFTFTRAPVETVDSLFPSGGSNVRPCSAWLYGTCYRDNPVCGGVYNKSNPDCSFGTRYSGTTCRKPNPYCPVIYYDTFSSVNDSYEGSVIYDREIENYVCRFNVVRPVECYSDTCVARSYKISNIEGCVASSDVKGVFDDTFNKVTSCPVGFEIVDNSCVEIPVVVVPETVVNDSENVSHSVFNPGIVFSSDDNVSSETQHLFTVKYVVVVLGILLLIGVIIVFNSLWGRKK